MTVSYDAKKIIRPNTQYNWTQEMVVEYAKCAKSVKYFAMNHCKVRHEIKGIIPLELRPYQMEILDILEKNPKTALLMPRRSGKSTIVGLYILWLAMFTVDEEPKTIYVLSNKGKAAKSILNDIKMTYEELAPFLKKGVVEYNKMKVEFDNRSVIITDTTTEDGIRGERASFMLLDEFAFVADYKAESFYRSVSPILSTGGSMCIVSTPNGNTNKFHEIYSGAVNGENDFVPYTIPWNAVPGRDEKFKESTIKNDGLLTWNQEYQCLQGENIINIRYNNKVVPVKVKDLYEKGEDFLLRMFDSN